MAPSSPLPQVSPPTAPTGPPRSGGTFPPLLLPLAAVLISLSLILGLNRLFPAPTQASAPPPAGEQQGSGVSPLPGLFTPEVHFWEAEIQEWSRQYHLDPNLIATVIQIESCGDPRAQSRAGASGLFQVMPYHFQPGEDPFQPDINAKRGLNYLRNSLREGKNIRLALAGYNGGIQGASRAETDWAKETQRYVYWGVKIYRDAVEGKDHSPRLEEWLLAGGNHLCRQAAARQTSIVKGEQAAAGP